MSLIAASALFVAASLPAPVGAAPQKALPAGTRDITATALGSQLLQESKVRLTARGISSKLRVVEDDAGYTIASADTEFVAVPVTLADGSTGITAMPVTAPQPAVNAAIIGSIQVAEAASPNWAYTGVGDCFARINHSFAWMDHCYDIYKMASDNNSTRDYYALQHHGYMGNNSPWTLGWGYVRSYRLSGTTAQNWVSASPGSGSTGPCNEIQLAVAALGVALVLPITKCEQWVVDKKNPAVDLRVDWFGPGTRNMREVGMEIAVWVTQGAWPQWVLPADADGGVV